MNIVISIHILPTEILEYERTIDLLNENLKYKKTNFTLYAVLNCSEYNTNCQQVFRSRD